TALLTIKEGLYDTNNTATLAVLSEYNEKMKNLRFQQYTSSNRIKNQERKVRAQGVKAEQEALVKMLERGDIPEETANVL
ncbi:Na+/H+ antiporter, partial [Bacillus spizizenii]|nr:Na+/H+ antiporter [Bacillus spizizenii]